MSAVVVPIPTTATLAVRPWPDPVIDALGHDPRSAYVEQYWLGILGPSTTWLLRRLAAGLEASPAGFDLPLSDTAARPRPGRQGRTPLTVHAGARARLSVRPRADAQRRRARGAPAPAAAQPAPARAPAHHAAGLTPAVAGRAAAHAARRPAPRAGPAASRSASSSWVRTPRPPSVSSPGGSSIRCCAARRRPGRGTVTGRPSPRWNRPTHRTMPRRTARSCRT